MDRPSRRPVTAARGVGTYVYALARSSSAPAIPRRLRGLPGTGPVRVLSVGGGLWLVVADAPLERYGAAAIEGGLQDLDWVSSCALGHESVIERVTKVDALAPMKLFTLFESDDRARTTVVRDRARLARILTRVAGREEWGVRVMLARRAAAPRRAPAGASPARGAGTAFLAGKKTEREAGHTALVAGRRAMGAIFTDLARRADAARRRGPAPAEARTRLLLDAAFLVSRGRATAFRTAADRLTRRLRKSGYEVTVTGPWPPYSFVADGR